ncbi:MAG: carbamoyltransferase HypF [Pseudobutyrivibrio sp.]|nr:carbamoyltransferase HypF [Pseudobutyrivibrio sp.]
METRKYTVKGLVQGIGFRPFVARLAEELNIDGWVRNTGGIVTVLACGRSEDLEEFYHRLFADVPTGGFVTDIEVEGLPQFEGKGFQIVESDDDGAMNLPLIPADIATCDTCKRELLDENNRRFLHPFISCTICGPRYSIVEKLPYDRETITMADFEMCPDCQSEYTSKYDIRRHAQTIGCHNCGPKLSFLSINSAKNTDKNAINQAVDLIKKGGILAVKDIGGFHLVCNPFDDRAVASLRALKHREAKAFAVMFEDIEQIREFCFVDAKEVELLQSPARPIVLLKRRKEGKELSSRVCLTSPDIGAMLPCNPVQILLAKECGPIIMTSGNASGDVLEIDNDKMLAWLEERSHSQEMKDVPLGILCHDRRILRPMDDSVMKVVQGRTQFIRRGRGHVPSPIAVDITGEIFAAGGDLKSSFCYVKNGLAYVSQYLGDLESVSCQNFYRNEKKAMAEIFGFKPKAAVADLHPSYFSRKCVEQDYASAKESGQTKGQNVALVQHHKAHVAAVIAEHKIKGPVLGFAFDGTGFGEDGTIWGSEVFTWDGEGSMERVAHLKPVKLIGGDEGAKNCDTILAAMLYGNGIALSEQLSIINENDRDKITQASDNTLIKAVGADDISLIMAAIDNNINVVESTSMGRLFDAVSTLLDVCHYNSYEGQAPIELENLAATTEEFYQLSLPRDGDTKSLFADIVYAISAGEDKAKIARGFINAVADYIVAIADENKINQVVLSGGTFLNRILLEQTIDKLESKNYKVYIAEQLPPGDGGICLGQAFLINR